MPTVLISRWRPPLLQSDDEKATAFHATLAKLNAINTDVTDTRTAILEEATAYLTSQLAYFCFEHINDLLLFDIRLGKYPANTGHEVYDHFRQKINIERDGLLTLITAMVFNLPSDNETNRRPRKHERPHDRDSDFSEEETQTPKYGRSGHSDSP